MKNIPPEIDRLLWAVAEDESPRAADEFVQRYPKYAGELARRRSMVQGLKGGRPGKAPTPAPRPAFRPAPVKSAGVPRRTMAVVGGLVLAAIAVASYTAASFAIPRPAPSHPAPVKKVPTDPVELDPKQTAPVPAPTTGTVPPTVEPTVPEQTEEPPTVASTAEKPQTFKVKGADLAGALTMLGVEAGIQIVVAPGMPKRTIDADYEDMPLSKILTDLARRYGFTPFDQGDGTIIIVPAVDGRDTPVPNVQDSGPSTKQRRIDYEDGQSPNGA